MPINISYAYNFGIVLLVTLIIQIGSGLLLVFFYKNTDIEVFASMSYVYIDVIFGFIIRNVHCIGANMFFLFVFLHIFKSYFYTNKKNQKVLFSGISIFFLLCGISFLGYVLPWGQMSLWGATVITNLLSVIPFSNVFLIYIWGDFSVSNSTMSRFFSLHFLLPFVLLSLVLVHFELLHSNGSSSASFSLYFLDYINMMPTFVFIDIIAILFYLFFFMLVLFFFPYYFFEADNFTKANSLVTPAHIKPEWYFLYSYAILRVFSNKTVGVIMLVVSLIALFSITLKYSNFRIKFYWSYLFILLFIFFFMILTFGGGSLVAYPFSDISALFTLLLFSLLLIDICLNFLMKIVFRC